ncbi:hypothetical protein ENKNEFLB_01674 [Nocardioides aquaticus]|uniref:MinD-like ATPase involved in chromosome partitioning or flagellar assembly n=1 Tax=Nocardioides aquaticus TaxID=160826 RepID=A0ABX8EL07_9ACTN|nr:hypothetical protein ENKNEFLB_01674 [Nocardioides aquaticus]
MSSGTLSAGTGSPARPFALEEVQAAVRALRAGEFRDARPTTRRTGPGAHPEEPRTAGRAAARTGGGDRHRAADAADWTPQAGERVLAVIGTSGSSGASTVALAVALSAELPARVIECCSASASGLAAATTAELGLHPAGWRLGRREQVLIERVCEVLAGVDEVPTPTPAEHTTQLTVLDVGWEVGQLTTTDSWVSDAVASADQVLLVSTSTVPGMRRLEGALELLVNHAGVHITDRTWVAVVGPRRKKWTRGVEHAGGPHARRALNSGRLVEIPEDRGLSIHGLDSRPVPQALLAAVAHAHAVEQDADHDANRDGDDEAAADELDLFTDHDLTDQPTDQPG